MKRPGFTQHHFYLRPSGRFGLRKSGAGFTLIELLVVAAVFSLLFLVATTVFISVQQRQRNILTRQRITADGRYVLEAIARKMRLGTIDYSAYPASGPAVPGTELSIRDQAGQTTCFYLDPSAGLLKEGSDCATGTEITPADLRVVNFWVYITPRSNPYASVPTSSADCRNTLPSNFDTSLGACTCTILPTDPANCFPDQRCIAAGSQNICQNAISQPQATIVIQTRAARPEPGQANIITVQTTVTSRLHGP